jgi:hypothetical protein
VNIVRLFFRHAQARSWTTGLSLAWCVLLTSIAAAHDETREAAERRRENVERLALAQADPSVAQLPEQETAVVTLRTIDAATNQLLPALVRVTNVSDGLAIRLPQEIHRANNWYSLAAETTLRLPRRKLKIEAVHGLESLLAVREIDLPVVKAEPLTPGPSPTRGEERRSPVIELPIRRFFDAKRKFLWSGNTHLHLRGLSIAEMDRYLRLVPQTDGLDVVFVSHLRRAIEDRDYTSNVLTTADLARLSTPNAQYGNGEEHRHNFGAGGQGYGHVMFLNIKQLIQPVSIGPGIMKEGTDGLPLKEGIEAARADGATVIWCHNRFGLEDVPNWLAERLDAQNIHDGSQVHGSYDETYYRYLNIGLAVPFSTGTDWFVYDFSRVYVPESEVLTPRVFLDQLKIGRSFITNGPLLEFTLDDARIGHVVSLDGPKKLRAKCRAVGRHDFRAIELVRNGTVVAAAKSQASAGTFTAEINVDVACSESSWFAVRIPDREQAKNELDQPLFAHTSPIYVEIDRRRVFQKEAAAALLAELKAAPAVIEKEGKFADEAERKRVLDVYREAIRTLEARIANGNERVVPLK